MLTPNQDITGLLLAAHGGETEAMERLLPLLYEELRGLARACLQGERPGHTLQPTALVHEAWMKLIRQDSVGVQHRSDFLAIASTVMRRILVDHARARSRAKRDAGSAPSPMDATLDAFQRRSGDLLELEDALETLSNVDARKAKLVELRFFVGLGMHEVANVLDISLRQAERDWTTARAWLRSRVSPTQA